MSQTYVRACRPLTTDPVSTSAWSNKGGSIRTEYVDGKQMLDRYAKLSVGVRRSRRAIRDHPLENTPTAQRQSGDYFTQALIAVSTDDDKPMCCRRTGNASEEMASQGDGIPRGWHPNTVRDYARVVELERSTA